ncbi:sugar transferase [Pseudalkalibacillus sp. Hm43]|uniref:sugar transferase n=1 Tax=Pseudalkalibacillus sp. Hm43 TaxID=3450742 RepID=UPI003F43FD2F
MAFNRYQESSMSQHTSLKYQNANVLYMKRILDVMFSIVALALCAPIILFTMLAIKIESPGSAIFKQERVGLNGRTFKVIKLRSMRNDAEKNGPQWASKNDPRVTKIGAFIRKTRIDELPQFINVLKGEMSIVGPRPERPVFVEQFNKEINGFDQRLNVKPGLTGLAQVNGGYEATPEEKLEYDLKYIDNLSVWNDFKIMMATVKVVFTGDGAR